MKQLAELARLELNAEESAAFATQLDSILGYFEQLQAVDVEGIEPMAHPFDASAPLREDIPSQPWSPGRGMANAPQQRDNQIVVPKVVDDA